MKTLRIVALLVFCICFLFSTTSCAVFVIKDNGKHKGWYKNPNNPHHPFSKNPGNSKGKSNK